MSHAYGSPADKNEMCELIAKAVDLGYNFFDTAEIYGTANNPHDNEALVGRALKPYRDKVIIATKFGIEFDKTSNATNPPLIPNSRPEVIRKSVEGSLKRLDTDHIDLYYQHRFDPNVPIEEVAGVMADLIKEGKITHWGMSEATEENIRKANSVCPLTAIQNRYSMMARHYESLFPVLEELNIGFVAFSPLANGFLSGKYNENSKFEKGTDYRTVMPQFTADGVRQNVTILSCDQYRKYRDLIPNYSKQIWTMTPWACSPIKKDAETIRFVSFYNVKQERFSGFGSSQSDYMDLGVTPVCLFSSKHLKLSRQTRLVEIKKGEKI